MINWPLAIAVSLAVHVVGIAFILSCTGSSKQTEDPQQEEAAPAPQTRPFEPHSSPALQTAEAPAQPASPADVTPARPPVQPAPPVQPMANTIVYTVVKGDSLTKLAALHCCTVTELAKLNKIKPTSGLRIGQRLKIPAPAEATR